MAKMRSLEYFYLQNGARLAVEYDARTELIEAREAERILARKVRDMFAEIETMSLDVYEGRVDLKLLAAYEAARARVDELEQQTKDFLS